MTPKSPIRPRRTAKQLEEEVLFLRSIIDQLPLALFCKDSAKDFQFVLWNKTAEALWGLTEKQVLGKSDADLFPPEQAAFFKEKDLECLRTGDPLVINEEPLDTIRGRLLLRTVKTAVPNPAGERQYLLGVSEDITEKAHLEAKLQQASKLSAMGEMAGGIAHEINNPLAIIVAKVSLIKHMLKSGKVDIPALESIATRVEDTTQRIARIIRGLRTISRDGERDAYVNQPLTRIISDTMDLCSERIKDHGIDFKADVAEDVVLTCRPVQISQVLMNLLANAVDAIDGAPEKWIRIEAQPLAAGGHEISVTDSGPGVPPDLDDKIMQPFFTTKPPGKGTGLGLSISRSIAQDHGGTLFLDRSSPRTRFVLRLPRPGPK